MKKFVSKVFGPGPVPIIVFTLISSIVFLLVVTSATIITFILPETYRSTARIDISTDILLPTGEPQPAMEYDPNMMQTELKVMLSEVVLAAVVEKLDLAEKWGNEFGGGTRFSTRDSIDMLKHSLIFRPIDHVCIVDEPNLGSIDPYVLQTEFEMIQSEPVLTKAIELLTTVQASQQYGGYTVLNKPGNSFNVLKDSVESKIYPVNNLNTLKLLNDALNLQLVRNIEIRAQSRNPMEAAAIANAVALGYQDYRQKMAAVREPADALSVRRVQIIDPATPSPVPYAPKKVLNIVLGIIFGVVFGSIAGAASARFVFIRRRRREPETSLSLGTARP